MDKIIALCEMKIYLTLSVLFLMALSSCTETYRIQLLQNGGAYVSQPYPFGKGYMEKYLESNVISELDTSGSNMAYRIEKVDSLGGYLSLLNPELVNFSIKKDTLSIYFSDEYPFTKEYHEGFKVCFNIICDRKIKELSSSDLKAVMKDDYSFEFSRSKSQMLELNRRPAVIYVVMN